MPVTIAYGQAFFAHTERFYAAMKAEATTVKVDGERVLIYRGRVTRLFFGLDLPNSYYSPAMQILKAMECVTVIARGAGRYTESEIALHRAPTWELYQEAVLMLDPDQPIEERRARALRKAARG